MVGECCDFDYEYPFQHKKLRPGCQFHDETAFFPCGNRHYCRFHLPMADGDGKTTVKPAWVEEETAVFKEAVNAVIDRAKEADRPANFTGVVFPSDMDFSEQDLPETLWYAAQFVGAVAYQKTAFSGAAWFDRAHFSSIAGFAGARFSDIASFSGASFSRGAGFVETHFSGDAWFLRASFSSFAWFRGASFSHSAGFLGTRFSGDAEFVETRFSGDAWFLGASFSSFAWFRGASFSGSADFSWSGKNEALPEVGKEQNENSSTAAEQGVFFYFAFSGGFVEGIANFSNRTFKSETDFSGRVFHQPPKFHEAKLHQGTKWRNAVFQGTGTADAEQDYRTLRLAMENIRDRPQEAVFFALEQRAMRHRAGWWQLRKWLSLAYDWTCDYGRSAGRPLCILLGFGVAFMAVYWLMAGLPAIDRAISLHLASLSLEQIVKPFGFWGRGGDALLTDALKDLGLDPQQISPNKQFLFKLLATLQSVLSLALLALFVLALRWQFRRG